MRKSMICAIFLIFALAGLVVGADEKAADSLRSRAEQYWKLRNSASMKEAYEFLSAETKKQIPFETFGRQATYSLQNVKVEDVSVSQDGKKGNVRLRYTVIAMGHRLDGAVETQQWILEGGSWYLEIKVKSLFAPASQR